MFISRRKHQEILAVKDARIKDLEEKLEMALRLKDTYDSVSCISGNFSGGSLVFPNNVAVYVDDYFGGKVIKQESNKVVVIDESGNATYSQTAKDVDKGYNYVLVRK